MSRAERALALLMRAEAVMVLCAVPAVVMPTAWMDAIHRGLGMGELPRSPLVEYLTRSLSMMYAGWGPLLFVLAADLRRYLPLVTLVWWLTAVFGVALWMLDLAVGMPPAWTWTEGPFVVGVGVVGLLLVRQVGRERRP